MPAKRPAAAEPSDDSSAEDLNQILGVPAADADEGAGLLDALAGAAGPRIETRLAHLQIATLARLVAGSDSAERKRANIASMIFPAIQADAALGHIHRDAMQSILTAACNATDTQHRAGLIVAYVCIIEARTVAAAVAGGLSDGDAIAALLGALARRRGSILDFNPVSVANALRSELTDATLAPLYAALGLSETP